MGILVGGGRGGRLDFATLADFFGFSSDLVCLPAFADAGGVDDGEGVLPPSVGGDIVGECVLILDFPDLTLSVFPAVADAVTVIFAAGLIL